jgi:hypothetical protein
VNQIFAKTGRCGENRFDGTGYSCEYFANSQRFALDKNEPKKQMTVETATYGSEFMVAYQASEQIMALCNTLRMMGIPIDGPTWMFGDNASVITSSTVPQSSLNKRCNDLSCHQVYCI